MSKYIAFRRRFRFEQLEPRFTMDGTGIEPVPTQEFVPTPCDWHNDAIASDVNRDGVVSPVDALLVINDIDRYGTRQLGEATAFNYAVDVNGDGFLSPIDVLQTINDMNGPTHDALVVCPNCGLGLDAVFDVSGFGTVGFSLNQELPIQGNPSFNTLVLDSATSGYLLDASENRDMFEDIGVSRDPNGLHGCGPRTTIGFGAPPGKEVFGSFEVVVVRHDGTLSPMRIYIYGARIASA